MAVVAMVKNSDNNKRRPTAAPTMKQGTVVACGVKVVDTWCNCGCITVALDRHAKLLPCGACKPHGILMLTPNCCYNELVKCTSVIHFVIQGYR